MPLNPEINYIVSGIERSGTSMLMQILSKGGLPTSSDQSRPPDEHNPKGYYELEGGKIINRLIEGTFPFEQYKGSFIKITAYGLKFLPQGNYVIIYSERNIEEIMKSMEKMAKITDENRVDTKNAFMNLNTMIKNKIQQRDDIKLLFINYNEILKNPRQEINSIVTFLKTSDVDIEAMIQTIDKKLYRQRSLSKA